jgi:metal-sulfur cluster biosynthetic enzyme
VGSELVSAAEALAMAAWEVASADAEAVREASVCEAVELSAVEVDMTMTDDGCPMTNDQLSD